MYLRELAASLDHLVTGKKRADELRRLLARLGIFNIAGLLSHYPRDYEDRSVECPLRNYLLGKVCTTVTVTAHQWFRAGTTRHLKLIVEDGSARASLVCFRRPQFADYYPVGSRFLVFGKFEHNYGEIQSSSFKISAAGDKGRGILPVYPLTGGLTQDALRSLMKRALKLYGANIENELPPEVISARGLMEKPAALAAVHFPDTMEAAEAARRTLIYEELFYLEIMVGKRAMERRGRLSLDKVIESRPEDAGPVKGKTKSQKGAIDSQREDAGSQRAEAGSLEGSIDSQREDAGSQRIEIDSLEGLLDSLGGSSDSPRVNADSPREDGGSPGADGGMRGEGAGERKTARRSHPAAPPPPLSPLQERLLERLPFRLTPGQTAAVEDINRDLDSPWPMARLLQGDVGAGKTLAAFLGMLRAVEPPAAGGVRGQAALMAPTELLARQHAENAARLLEPLGVRIAFLSGNVRSAGRTMLLKALAAGEVDIVCGTHALFSKDVRYRNLRFVVIDEQHRFGVTQRSLIMDKGDHPGLLMMSATPIPRTLALTVFGDLDVSVIADMPPGRKPVKTHLARQSNADKVYAFVRRELAAGRQAYFVYPVIDEAEGRGELRAAETMARKLAEEVFPEFPAALIHSRLDEEEKRRTMDSFRAGETKVLVATSVVEVGVDVPTATCMVIEHAERFGLSALHQLRGRVGRGDTQSYCFLIYSDQDVPEGRAGMNPVLLSEEERSKEGRRLMVMLENNDGFVIAEKDLQFRGPGQIAGVEQSGYLALGIADPVRDTEALADARADAFAILEGDPGLLASGHRRISGVLDRAPPFSEVGV
ncbi:MAG: ATP-dependent DNA helicase RecG [Treponematales bacterium]